MRQIGSIENRDQAERFAAYLTAQGTACTVDAGNSGQVVWVHEEDRVAAAKEELQRFRSEPDHERYRDAAQKAAAVVRQREQSAKAARRRVIDVRDRWVQPTIANGPFTVGLIVLMAYVGYLTRLDPQNHRDVVLRLVFTGEGILSGEVWRLVSPIFLHKDVLHFLFNLICLRDFGLNIEYRIGTPKFLAMVLVIAVLSNTGQYVMAGPFLGGMSGVNYGLFGYIWVRSKLEPESGFWISQSNIVILFGWFVMCLVLPIHAANWAHGVGLAVGAAIGTTGTLWKSLTGQR